MFGDSGLDWLGVWYRTAPRIFYDYASILRREAMSEGTLTLIRLPHNAFHIATVS